MTTYPSENVVFLYAYLALSQAVLTVLSSLGQLPQPNRIVLTLRHASLMCAFLWLALGTMQPPALDLVAYRWLLRGSYIAYALVVTAQLVGIIGQWRKRRD